MAKVEVKNIVKGRISPNDDTTPDMEMNKAFELMVAVVNSLRLNGWWIHDNVDNEQFKGYVLKKVDECDCELAVSIHVKKF